jgi:hypothetical protein
MTTSQAPSTHETVASTATPANKPVRQATKPRKTPVKKSSPVTAKSATPTPQKAASQKATPAKPATPLTAKKSQPSKSKPVKEKKVKVLRDSFTIPKTEFTQIAEMKKRAMTLGVEVKKSELIRAGLQLISGLQDAAFKKALASVPTLKTGRPAKD